MGNIIELIENVEGIGRLIVEYKVVGIVGFVV